ncbi:MAG: hypothetical protein JJ866_17585 [Roseibium sp.]|uniref:cysteine rich repeat-containing protein n=1 Tax=Roseibium sp. TaxID=1936156 RepID=UPI001B1F17DC|nr:cysteine rich repeat-containing protein [Roseibium sp.]MBO6893759.1 hypothetical protein [Roseibium sp.]MBO6928580.1 hypothetical protein [Roseibium sp.]
MLNTSLLKNGSVAAISLSFAVLTSAPVASQGFLEACEKEIVEYCSAVEPGNGRLVSCLYAHETKVSDKCGDSFDDIADVIDNMFFTIGSALAICAVDLEQYCAGTQFGQGRLISCLAKAEGDLQPECGKIVTELSKGLAD